ncbi:MAG: ABC transporter substrate-binding protein [Alphaproteobacteria bacterium]|nr:ABC transporter substrate-binding protein [Alphaproteobacteria bacterium]
MTFCVGVLLSGAVCAAPQHGISMHGTPKYEADFFAFDYVNPEAPKKGTLSQGAIGMFDTFNPYVINGIAPAGVGLMHDTLMKQSLDEPFSLYGLIARTIDVPDDRSWVAFEINPDATFSDGSKITPADVIFSFEILRDKGLPTYRYYYGDVDKVYQEGDNRVVFKFKEGVNNRELPLILGELPILSKSYWQDRDFTKTSLDIPVVSGAYVVDSFDPAKFIEYRLNPNYWAMDLNVNRGQNNFEKIKYDYYRDATVMSEAFKAGAIDIRQENEAKKWAALKNEPAILEGRLKQKEFAHQLPSGMQGFVFNLRRPIFADAKVREALSYAFDFSWANQNLFHGLYKRTTSYFDNSYLKSPPLPTPDELKLLAPYRAELPQDLFNTAFMVPSNDSGKMRHNLKTALDLLAQSGWTVQNGVLQNALGDLFEFEILLDAPSAPMWERVLLPFVGQLKRLGIKARIATVDVIQYKNRLDAFDYDMIVSVWGQSLSPGNEQRYYWGSEAADSKGSMNYAGVKDPVIDALIDKVISATTAEELTTATHALDRVLLWSYLVVPHWHTPVLRYVYWDKFEMPKGIPMKGISPLTWWVK